MRRIHPFVYGHVIGAFLVGGVAGAFLDLKALMIFSSLMAANAVIGSLVCWWRPGFDAAWWKLWLVATFANPMMLAAIAFSIDQYDCLIGQRTGWNCLHRVALSAEAAERAPYLAELSESSPFTDWLLDEALATYPG